MSVRFMIGEPLDIRTDDGVVAGIDVGGRRKGFHAVSIERGRVRDVCKSVQPPEILEWCVAQGVRTIGVDAPCRWSTTGGARNAERQLARAGIRAFSTPGYAKGSTHPFYRWMLNGADLYSQLETRYRLFDGTTLSELACFETFPQAIACSLAGRLLVAAEKLTDRRSVLVNAGLETTLLTNIDYVDAALCALAASYVRAGRYTAYGDAQDGYIFVPALNDARDFGLSVPLE